MMGTSAGNQTSCDRLHALGRLSSFHTHSSLTSAWPLSSFAGLIKLPVATCRLCTCIDCILDAAAGHTTAVAQAAIPCTCTALQLAAWSTNGVHMPACCMSSGQLSNRLACQAEQLSFNDGSVIQWLAFACSACSVSQEYRAPMESTKCCLIVGWLDFAPAVQSSYISQCVG